MAARLIGADTARAAIAADWRRMAGETAGREGGERKGPRGGQGGRDQPRGGRKSSGGGEEQKRAVGLLHPLPYRGMYHRAVPDSQHHWRPVQTGLEMEFCGPDITHGHQPDRGWRLKPTRAPQKSSPRGAATGHRTSSQASSEPASDDGLLRSDGMRPCLRSGGRGEIAITPRLPQKNGRPLSAS